MKALTICQPYADMIATGEKVIENRTWPTSYRGPLAIHAGKSKSWLEPDDIKEREWAYGRPMAFGAVVATAELYDCVRVESLPPELANRDDANGPWCWLLRDVEAMKVPVPYRGAQGLWEFEQ